MQPVNPDCPHKERRKTLDMILFQIGFSVTLIIFSHLVYKPVNSAEISKEVIRLILEVCLFYAVFIGKFWARILFTLLYSIAVIILLVTMISMMSDTFIALVFLVPLSIYGYAIYFFNFDKSFLIFFKYQRRKI